MSSPASRPFPETSIEDKYTLESGQVLLTAIQALVRLPMMQRRLDEASGLNTAGFISGYRGSPLGGLDLELWRARAHLERHRLHFQPGVNEDLAATSVWGSQQANLFKDARYDGVFGMWYGKGPGVDRCGDVFKHGNAAGSSRFGGVLLVAGDDHAAKSSTLPHQSEYAFMDAMIPVLNPAGVQEVIDFGLYGWAMSRFSGCWVALKVVSDLANCSAVVEAGPARLRIVTPKDLEVPPGGLNIRWPDSPLEQEHRLIGHKLQAAMRFAAANRLDRLVIDSPRPRVGIVTTGKSYLDVLQALRDLGIGAEEAAQIGLRLYKVGLSWPLVPDGIRSLAEGLEEIIVIEEKRPVIENQMKSLLYSIGARPRVVGKSDESGRELLPATYELTPELISRVVARRFARFHTNARVRQRMTFLDLHEATAAETKSLIERMPYFCSGCPHNTSTRVPEGSRAIGGVGCHYMATWMDRGTATFTHMGGEGVTWIGQAPFTDTPHIFQNLGDGTYFHSGILAIRAALAAKVNVTFKLLFNEAVAMTGGQPLDGELNVSRLTHQLRAEGVRRIAVVADDPGKYREGGHFAPGTTFHHRNALDRVQREMRQTPGVTVIIYDQMCAAEKRRKRKRGLAPEPPARVFINEAVCEGCGDCGTQSNCLSVVPLPTEFGLKRAIDQFSCNVDLSCLKGFCPSFVTIQGGKVRGRAPAVEEWAEELPGPERPSLDEPYGILVAGVGGSGVTTVGALLGMAAHLEGKAATVLDMTGLAQKGGAVTSHVRIAQGPEMLHSARITAGGAALLLGCDLVVAAGPESLSKVRRGATRALVNAHESPTGAFTHDPDADFPGAALRRAIRVAVGAERVSILDASRLAASLGDALMANVLMLGWAYQMGCIPLSEAALLRAIELNAVAVDANKRAFRMGRRAACEPAVFSAWTAREEATAPSLEEIVARRSEYLKAYQDAAYAGRYARLVRRVHAAEAELIHGAGALAEAVSHSYFKLLAYKDEYEVARLYSNGDFLRKLGEQFEGGFRIAFHFAPPLLPARDPETGEPRKRIFGPWMLNVLRLLARLKFLRGTMFDPFGRTAERRVERRLIRDYEEHIEEILTGLGPENHALAVEIARIPEGIRGFGHVKMAHLERAKKKEAELFAAFRGRRAAGGLRTEPASAAR